MHCLSDHLGFAGLRVHTFRTQVVHHLAMIVMLCSAVPIGHRLAVDEQLEQIRCTGRMWTVDAILEPDLTAGVDRHVTGSGSSVVRGSFVLVKWVLGEWVEAKFGKLADIELRDDRDLDASKLDHPDVSGLCSELRMKQVGEG